MNGNVTVSSGVGAAIGGTIATYVHEYPGMCGIVASLTLS
jgi:hypothetical protein